MQQETAPVPVPNIYLQASPQLLSWSVLEHPASGLLRSRSGWSVAHTTTAMQLTAH